MPALRERSVVVTGAASGIGRACVESLIASGWGVVGIDQNARGLDELPAQVIRVVGDVREYSTHEHAARKAAELGPLRGWVNNAAVQIDGRADELSEADMRVQLDVNIVGTAWGHKAAAQFFPGEGSVVSLASIHAHRGFSSAFAYAATKGAIVAMMRQFAVEYGARGIRANSISPGAIATDMCFEDWARSADPDAARRADERLHLADRMGQAAEVASVVGFLLSDAASLVTGQDLAVDGGATARVMPGDAPTDPHAVSVRTAR